jgi:hypothetical protein
MVLLKNLLEMKTWSMNFAMFVESDSERMTYTDEMVGMGVLLKT